MEGVNGREAWLRAYRELLRAVTSMGYPEEFGKLIARNLGSEKTMKRMTDYLYSARPASAEEIADEMLSIMSDRDRWKDLMESREANARYNAILNGGLFPEEGE